MTGTDRADVLEAWAHWVKRGLIRDWPQERAEIAYHAFCAAWVSSRSRDLIIAALAARYGPHKAYVSATRTYEPDGNDAEGSCMVSQIVTTEETWHTCGDGPCDGECKPVQRAETQLSPLTYGEIADALTGGES